MSEFLYFIKNSTSVIRKALVVLICSFPFFVLSMCLSIWLSGLVKTGDLLPPTISDKIFVKIVELAVLGAVALALHSLWVDWDKWREERKNCSRDTPLEKAADAISSDPAGGVNSEYKAKN